MTPPALLLLLLLAAGALTPRAAAQADSGAADDESDGEASGLVQTTPRTNFLRLGRGSAPSAFLRLGRARAGGGASSSFMRLGRGSERNFLRFGRARQGGEEVADDGEELAREARAGMADPLTRHDRNFIRFGRSGTAQHTSGAEQPLWAALLDPRLTVLPAPMGFDEADVDGASGSGRARISTRSFLRLG